MRDTLALLDKHHFPALKRDIVETLQVNLGYLCNQQCVHCHVNAGPTRKEIMALDTIEHIILFLKQNKLKTIDLTGGAPELNPHFKYLVKSAKELGIHVIDRCNLTVLFYPGQEDLAQFLTDNQVEIIASMPCYLEENVDKQRGKGVFQQSINALKKLNKLGYAKHPELPLNLVYNPQGPVLPPPQQQLQADYKRFLQEKFDIHFNQLFTLTNMPIKRFGSMLASKNKFETYMTLLKQAYQHKNLQSVMCKSLISVDWLGYLYDCDFNQMLNLPLITDHSDKMHISQLATLQMTGNAIQVRDHCYACTAGQGSSCGGALV